MNTQQKYYASLKKPSFAPPSWLFGPVWAVLYAIIAVSFGYVWYRAFYTFLPLGYLLPFLLNVGFNIIYSPIQFRLRSNVLAAVDAVLIFVTLVYALVHIYHVVPWVAYVNLPYVAWTAFASVLQISIAWLNRKSAK